MKTKAITLLLFLFCGVAFSFNSPTYDESDQLSSYVDATLQGSNSSCGWIWSRCGDGAIFYTQTVPYGTTVGNIYKVERVRKNTTTCWEWDVLSVSPLQYCNIW